MLTFFCKLYRQVYIEHQIFLSYLYLIKILSKRSDHFYRRSGSCVKTTASKFSGRRAQEQRIEMTKEEEWRGQLNR